MTAKQVATFKRIAIPTGIVVAVALVWWYFSRGSKVNTVTQPGTSGSGLPTYAQQNGGATATTPAASNPAIVQYVPQSYTEPQNPFPQQPTAGPVESGVSRLDYNVKPVDMAKIMDAFASGQIPAAITPNVPSGKGSKSQSCGGGCGDCCDDCSKQVRYPDSQRTTITSSAEASTTTEGYEDYLRRMIMNQYRVN